MLREARPPEIRPRELRRRERRSPEAHSREKPPPEAHRERTSTESFSAPAASITIWPISAERSGTGGRRSSGSSSTIRWPPRPCGRSWRSTPAPRSSGSRTSLRTWARGVSSSSRCFASSGSRRGSSPARPRRRRRSASPELTRLRTRSSCALRSSAEARLL